MLSQKLTKLRCLLAVVFICFLLPMLASAGTAPGSGVVGSVHDMNTFAFVINDEMGRVCVFCHVPHHAYSEAGTLWSRPLDEEGSGLKPYTWSETANTKISQKLDPLVGPSRLCMTCHDGAIALDPHGGVMPKEYVISTDLDFTHPIGFSYDEAMTTRGPEQLVEKTEQFASKIELSDKPGEYNTITRKSAFHIQDVLFQGSVMTCVTCHDVHNKGNVTPDPGHKYNYLLWAKEEGSLICLSCHKK